MKKKVTIIAVLIYIALLALSVSCKVPSLASQNGKREFESWEKEHKRIDKAESYGNKGSKNEPQPEQEELQLWLEGQPLENVVIDGKEGSDEI